MEQLSDVIKSYNAKATIITAYIAKDNRKIIHYLLPTQGGAYSPKINYYSHIRLSTFEKKVMVYLNTDMSVR